MRIADYSVTKAVLERHGFTFKKSFGQNFLTDTNILQKIVDTAEIDKQVNVIEIGPGIGALTEFLAENAAEVMAFEIDDRLVPILADTLRDFDNVTVVNQDILKVDLNQYIAEFKNPELPIKVVANLPYYITTPILMHLIESKIPFQEFVVMMQKEVGERILAEPATKAYGVLSLAVGYYCTIAQVVKAPKEAFVPRPKVDSIVLRLDLREKKPVDLKSEKLFFEVIRSGFGQRRKTMNNSLAGVAGLSKENIEEVLSEVNIDGGRRAETLSMGEFAVVANGIWDYLART